MINNYFYIQNELENNVTNGKNWGFSEVPTGILFRKVEELEKKVNILEQKYKGALVDIRRLEEENIETNNCLYENYNSIDSVNFCIDILNKKCGIDKDA